ncbi:hypothetical protein RIF29_36213 [Crotalaria pallida]|uniref:Transmembrane protein n=1 Tax=Crotalaria pallida TaxID=3830 RepID=A0AAN9EB25_CROPI
MASRVKFTMFTAFFIVLVVVVADAHEGHDHNHLAPSPAEGSSNYASSLNYDAVVGGVLTLLLTFLIVR